MVSAAKDVEAEQREDQQFLAIPWFCLVFFFFNWPFLRARWGFFLFFSRVLEQIQVCIAVQR